MPVVGPGFRLRMRQRGGGNQIPVRPVGLPAMVLPPCAFTAVGQQMPAADAMVDAELRPAQPGEKRFGPIGRSAVFAQELNRVVDALGHERGMKDVPGVRFIRVYGRSALDGLAHGRNRIGLFAGNPGPRVALALAGDNNDLLLIFFPLLPAIGLAVLGARPRSKKWDLYILLPAVMSAAPDNAENPHVLGLLTGLP